MGGRKRRRQVIAAILLKRGGFIECAGLRLRPRCVGPWSPESVRALKCRPCDYSSSKSILSKQFRPIPDLTSMNLVLIVLILLILLGGGGGYYYGGPYVGGGIGSLVLLILIIWLLFGRRGL